MKSKYLIGDRGDMGGTNHWEKDRLKDILYNTGYIAYIL